MLFSTVEAKSEELDKVDLSKQIPKKEEIIELLDGLILAREDRGNLDHLRMIFILFNKWRILLEKYHDYIYTKNIRTIPLK